jgi:hypothetical protein
MNSMIEANFGSTDKKEKNYLYEFINIRFTQKITTTFKDLDLLKRIEGNSDKRVNIDQTTKKITFLVKKPIYVDVSNNKTMEDLMDENSENCDVTISIVSPVINTNNNNFDLLTNCPDGKFHKWGFVNNDMLCSLCNQSYTELIKLYENTTVEDQNKNYLQKLRMITLNKLAKKYCISGDLHELDNETLKCTKCKKNPDTTKFTEKELEKMEKNIEEKTYESNLESFKLMKKHLSDEAENKDKLKSIMDKFDKRYLEKTNNKLYSYVSDFIDRLIKILGVKIKIKDNVIYLKETYYVLDHDYLGNKRKEVVYILSSDQKVETYVNHPYYKIDVLYYKDKANNVFVYYDLITLQYLGY